MKNRLALILLIITAFYTQGQQLRFTNFSLNQGLAQSQVFCIIENSQGYIFMGTRGGGLCLFNGLEFENFTTQQNLSGNYINHLLEDSTQTMWVATNLGLSTFKNQTIQSIPFFKDQEVSSLALVNNRLWVVSNGKLYLKQDSLFKKFELEKDLKKIRVGRGHEIWGISNNSLLKINNQTINNIPVRENLECLDIDVNGNVWLGTYGDGIWVLKDQKLIELNKKTGLKDAIVNGIFCENDKVWISTLKRGVCVFELKDSTASFLTEENGLANNHAKVTYKDRWGNYWMGTSGGGVSKYSGQYFEKFTQKNGLNGNYIYQVFVDSKQRTWVSTSGGGVTILDSGFTQFKLKNGFVDHKVKAIFESKDGSIWLGTEGAGLAIWLKDTFKLFNTQNGLSGNWVKDFVQDKYGHVWVATSGGGISKFYRDSVDSTYAIKKFTTQNGLLSNRVNALTIDDQNRIWYSTQQWGIGVVVNDSVLENFTVDQGLKSNNMRSLHYYNNVLWLGNARGLNFIETQMDTLQIKSLPKSNGLSSQNIYLIEHDKDGHLWVGTEKGVDQVKLDYTNILEIKHFGADNGFDGVETNTNASHLDQQGNIWFGTVDGLYKFTNTENIESKEPPLLSFTQITLSHVIEDKATPVLAYNKNRIGLNFIGISQSFPKKVEYKWRLLGLDTSWSDWSNKRAVEFLNLSPGQYQFSLVAKNENNLETPHPLVYRFEVETPFWQKLIFKGVVGLLVLLTLLGLYKSRIASLKRKSKAQNEKVLLQSKVIQLQQRALQLQMNPHFIFNTLNSIQALIATRDADVARKYLTQFSKLMRSILEGSRSNSILLADEIETLENYLELEQFCYENKFDFKVEVDQDAETELIEIPSMILQPFVENAILHGATKSKNKGFVEVKFTAHTNFVECLIIDNGPGLSVESNQKSGHKSSAIAITTERLELMNGNKNAVRFENKTDQNGAVIGLQVWIKLPIL